ncbi:MAG: NAD(P)H-hydrate epimerase, partial [Xanthomonadales bacterium]|nr:NAD(P)H-hydrate epimerase [Xanthomonadales bacterium]
MYTADQVRQLDAHAIEHGGIESFALMQRAGRAAFREIRERHPQAAPWCVVTGAGNNAGDGFEVACLAREAGLDVQVVALRPVAALQGDAARAAAAWLNSGGTVRAWPDCPAAPALVVDALLGTGLGRDVEGEFAEAVAWINSQVCPVVALDVPSGLDSDTGSVRGCAVRAALTVSFVGRKRGLYTADGPDHSGERVFDALGAPEPPTDIADAAGRLLARDDIAAALPPRVRNAHKGRNGHVLVIGGAAGMGGAVRLAGEAA